MGATRELLLSQSMFWDEDGPVSAPWYLFPMVSRLCALPEIEIDGDIEDFYHELFVASQVFTTEHKEVAELNSEDLDAGFMLQCYRVSEKTAKLCSDEGVEVGGAEFLKDLVEIFYKEFGPKVLLIEMAFGVMRSKVELPAIKCDLFDESFSLIERVAHAGRNGDRWAYWQRAMENTRRQMKRFSLQLLYCFRRVEHF